MDLRLDMSINGENFSKMITKIFWSELGELDISGMCFIQDGATCHSDVKWPPMPFDFTSLDFVDQNKQSFYKILNPHIDLFYKIIR